MAYRCKVCGLLSRDKPKVCPACGSGSSAFEQYKIPVSGKRFRILELHLHPVSVHFPQAAAFFAALFFFLNVMGMFPDSNPYAAGSWLSLFLFPSTVLTFILGLFDGKTRFGKLDTPYMKRKIISGSFALLISTVLFGLILFTVPLDPTVLLLLSILYMIPAGYNGYLGGQLVCSVTKG